ncbi:hypothetical protein PG997_005801 [Apiospora hydei]|uniref:Uncharacterized protein n=1 Tax=Apiospora hydei TaxID=1337664 RepID=A0ABR1WPX5_9PEZI
MDLHQNPRTLAGPNTRDTHAEFRHARHSNGNHPFPAANMISMGQEPLSASPRDTLLSYLPAFIKSSSSNDEPDFHFSLWEPTVGSSISGLTQPLTPPERRIVEYQKGHLVRHISQFRAPNSRFGPAAAVLRGAPCRSDENLDGNAGLPMPPPSVDIIRDGEDLTVMLNYSRIREQMARFSYTLDNVMESRLVLIDAGSDRNVLVTRSTKAARLEEGSTRATCTKNGSPQAKPSVTSRFSCNSHKESATFDNVKRVGEATGTQGVVDATEAKRISVTGLLDWSNCIFGDPLMAKVFSRNPSDDFLRGPRHTGIDGIVAPNFHEHARVVISTQGNKYATNDTVPNDVVVLVPATKHYGAGKSHGRWIARTRETPGGSDERMKDCNNNNNADEEDNSAAIRLLLYECYHATVCVIKTFYRTRPPAESKQREMAARRHLTEVLHKLSQVQSEPVGNSHDNSNASRNSGGSGSSGGSGGDGKGPKSRRASGDGDDEADGWPIKRRRSEVG